MNQHINQELLWKNHQSINPSTANGNSFDDKTYHGTDKIECDRSTSNSTSFNQFQSKPTSISKTKDYKNYNEIEPESFEEGIYIQSRAFNNQSSVIQKPQTFSSEPGTMLHQFDNNSDSAANNNTVAAASSVSKLRHNNDQPMTDEYLWFYLDPRNNVQGPFLDSQMFQWWSQGIYFQNSLLMKRKCDADFSTLQDYSKRFNGVPFSRKDIRVTPLTESLTMVQSPMYSNGPMHRTNHQVPPLQQQHQQQPTINDNNYLLHQLLSSVPGGQNSDELSKLLHKVNLQQRVIPQSSSSSSQQQQLNLYEQSLVPGSIQNGTDPFVNISAQSSLSNFVNLRLNNQQMQSSQNYNNNIDLSKTGYNNKNDRYQSSSWAQIQQPKLTDSVWTSTTDDTILNSNPVWSRSTNDTVGNSPSLLNSIFQDSQQKANSIPSNINHSKLSNPMQETWDNLDPAIIKIVPPGDSANHTFDSGKAPKDNNNITSTVQMDQRAYPTSNNNPSRTHSDNVKHPWADLVRKGTTSSTSNQKSKSGFNTEHDTVINHSVSPNQHKTSMTSSSSDEYDQRRRSESSDKDLEALIQWSTNYLEKKPGISEVDIGTLIELLIYVESPYEVEATMRENVPQFDNISDFVKVFIEKRRPLRQRLFSENIAKQKTASSTVTTVSGMKKSDPETEMMSGTEAGVSQNTVQPQAVVIMDGDSKWQVKSRGHHHGLGSTTIIGSSSTSTTNTGTGATVSGNKKKRAKNSGRN